MTKLLGTVLIQGAETDPRYSRCAIRFMDQFLLLLEHLRSDDDEGLKGTRKVLEALLNHKFLAQHLVITVLKNFSRSVKSRQPTDRPISHIDKPSEAQINVSTSNKMEAGHQNNVKNTRKDKLSNQGKKVLGK